MTTLSRVLQYFGIPDVAPEQLGPSPIELRDTDRMELPKLFAALELHVGAEIGTWHGEYAEKFCQADPLHAIFVVDAWTPYEGYPDYRRQDTLTAAYNAAMVRLAPYNVKILRRFSVDAASLIPDKSLDWLYLDANHGFEPLVADFAAWMPKLRPGGIIAGHDYDRSPRHHHIRVREAVQGYTAAYGINPWFLLGRWKYMRGERRDRERSYFWVKP